MVEIYSYGVDVNEQYARNQQLAETFQKQYHVPAAGTGLTDITTFQHLIPTPSTLVLINGLNLGVLVAKFSPPLSFTSQETGGHYILGSPSMQEAEIDKVQAKASESDDPTLVDEAQTLSKALREIQDTNNNSDAVRDNILRFIQG